MHQELHDVLKLVRELPIGLQKKAAAALRAIVIAHEDRETMTIEEVVELNKLRAEEIIRRKLR